MNKRKMLENWLNEEYTGENIELGTGRGNKFNEFILSIRELMIKTGFDEVELPIIEPKRIRDFSFYASDAYTLSKPTRYYSLTFDDLKEIIPDVTENSYKKVTEVLDEFSNGKIHAIDLPRVLVKRAGLLLDQAILVCDKSIPTRSKTSNFVARYSMASSWISKLEFLYKRYPSPKAYFTIGLVLDPLQEKVQGRPHLSGIIVGGINAEQMVKLVTDLLSQLNISPEIGREVNGDILLMPSSYHAISYKGTRIGYSAQFSFTSLERAGIDDPVAIFDLDLLNLYRAMGNKPLSDLYPYLFGEWYLSDSEIASHLKIAKRPITDLGKSILVSMRKTIDLYASQPAPCEFKVFEKEFDEKALEVWVVGCDKKLVGPGFNNEIIVYKGDILALPTASDHEAILNGVRTGIRMGDSILNYIARQLELNPLKPRKFEYDMATLENSNILIPKQVLNYVSHIGSDIKFEVPVKLCVEARVRKLWVYKKGH